MPDRAYVLKGDPALVADALHRLLADLRAADLDVEELGGDDLTVGSVIEACNAYFLGGADKAVVVRDAQDHLRGAEDVRRITGYLADPNPQTSLVLVLSGDHKKLVDGAKKAGATVVDPSPPGHAKARSTTAASDTAPSTTNTPPGPTATTSPLDTTRTWDV